MKKNTKLSFHPKIKRINYVLMLSGLATTLIAPTNLLAGNFPSMPLHLQDQSTTTTPAGVKPNVMLYIDDSGSMSWSVAGSTVNNATADTRMMIVQRSLNQVLNKNTDKMNWGIQTLHNNIRSTSSGNSLGSTGRDLEIRGWLGLNNATKFSCSADHSQSNYQAANGSNFTDDFNLIRRHIACLNASGGTPTTTRYNVIAPLMIKNQNLQNRCQKSYIVLLSDGDADQGQAQLQTVSYPYYNNDQKKTPSNGNDAFGISWDTSEYPTQNINTYTIGFGPSLSTSGRNYLRNGATPDANDTGSVKNNFFNPLTEAQLVQAFDKILESISSQNATPEQKVYSSSAPAVSSNYVDGLAAAASLNTGSWSSELLFYDVNSAGKLNLANPKRASFNNRKLIISNGTTSDFLYDPNMAGFINDYYAIPNVNINSAQNNTTEWRDGLLTWMARAKADNNIKDTSQKVANYKLDYRVRPDGTQVGIPDQRSMGDIIDNSILAIGDMSNNKQEFVVTSTNDGLVYVFQSSNSTQNPYDLKFNFAPSKIERNSNDGSDYVGKYYKFTTENNYGRSNDKPHRFLLNGGMVTRRTDDGGNGKQIFLASSMGQAGRGAFAMNIGGKNRGTGQNIAASNMNNANWYKEVKLFETESGANNKLGFTIGSPQVGRIQYNASAPTNSPKSIASNIHYATFLGNGYNYSSNYADTTVPVNDKPTLYLYETLGQDVGTVPGTNTTAKGSVLKQFTIPSGTGGLATPTLVDTNFDGLVDVAYAGDYGGNLYRFNITSPNPNDWTYTKIFQTQANQPITTAPAVFRTDANHYTVVIGTGSDIYQEDLDLKNPQALYGLFDDLSKTDGTALIDQNSLLQQSLSTETVSYANNNVDIRKVSNNTISTANSGWTIPLDNSNGERVTIKPNMIGNTVLLTTRVYEKNVTSQTSKDPCVAQVETATSSAYSWILQLNVSNGGLITQNTKSVYIDYNMGSSAFFTATTGNTSTNYLISGQRQNSLTSLTFIDTMVAGSAVTKNGDSGGSGDDPSLTNTPQTPKNDCVGRNSKVFGWNTNGQSETFDVNGVCSDNSSAVKRLSWREIF